MNRRYSIVFPLLAVLAAAGMLLAVAGPAFAADLPDAKRMIRLLQNDLELPEEWAGIWSTLTEIKDCETGTVFNTDTSIDTLCAGTSIDEDSGDETFNVTCTGTVSGTTFDYVCTGTGEVFEGCTATMTIDMDGTRTGDSYTSTAILNFVYNDAACGDLEPTCTRIDISGTRVGPEPPSCAETAVEPVSWGSLKTWAPITARN